MTNWVFIYSDLCTALGLRNLIEDRRLVSDQWIELANWIFNNLAKISTDLTPDTIISQTIINCAAVLLHHKSTNMT